MITKKEIKTRFRNFLRKHETKRHRDRRNLKRSLKTNLRIFFEGYTMYGEYGETDYTINPKIDYPVHNFGITNFDFKFKKDFTIMIIYLERPGLFIGKSGKQIEEVQRFLSTEKHPVKIHIKESNIWS